MTKTFLKTIVGLADLANLGGADLSGAYLDSRVWEIRLDGSVVPR